MFESLRQHVDSMADVTIGCLTVPRAEASAFGCICRSATSMITCMIPSSTIISTPMTTITATSMMAR